MSDQENRNHSEYLKREELITQVMGGAKKPNKWSYNRRKQLLPLTQKEQKEEKVLLESQG